MCFSYAHRLSYTSALKPGVEGRVNMRCSAVGMMKSAWQCMNDGVHIQDSSETRCMFG